MPDSIEMAGRWLRASGIPVTNEEIRAWLDDRGIPVMTFAQQLFSAVRQAVIQAGDAGYIEGREQAAEALRAYAQNYPESVFPPDSDSRDAIGGTAMRHAYNNAASIAEAAVSGSSRGARGDDGRPVDLWLGPPRRDLVRLADLDLHDQGQA